MSKEKDGMTRRELLERAGIAATAGLVGPALTALPIEAAARPPKKTSPNNKIILGLIGCGGMGMANVRAFMNYGDVEVAAVCDVDEARIPKDAAEIEKKYGRKPDVYKDYRRILDRKDIDAVVIGSPDHWHALQLIHSCEAGKDSFCEKPISHNIVEAISMAGAVKRFNRVVQVGTWQRSTKEFTDAIRFIRTGKLGKIVACRAWITDNFRAGNVKPSTPPASLDYDMWTGPAKLVPYRQNACHYNWRWFMNYGGGLATDWGVHMMDIAMLGMSKSQDLVMPQSVSSVGGILAFVGDDRDAPDTTETIYSFKDPDFVMTWSVKRDHPGLPGHGTEFISADGKTLRVWRGGWVVLDADGKELPKEEGENPPNHWRDFLDCVKSRKQPRADLRSIAQTTIVCHLANVALYAGETVRWDAQKMDLVGKVGRQTQSYRRSYRKPYSLPNYAW